jgi:hypothetical protein
MDVAAENAGQLDPLAAEDLAVLSVTDTTAEVSSSDDSLNGDVTTQTASTLESDAYGGSDPYGGDPYGGDPDGGDPYGGDPDGGDPYGGDPYGGDPYGGTAPTTSGIPDVNVLEDASNEVVSLYDAFEDAEDPDNQLTYEVVENTNPSLFASVHTDGYGGLVLDFAEDAYGTADLTVRATDTDEMWVETSFEVEVDPVNDAPVIHDFVGIYQAGDYWKFQGYVTDVDDDVEGMIVALGGVLEPYGVWAMVQADGTFSITQAFVGLQSGYATAQTEDDDGAESNLEMYYVNVA